LTNGKNRIGKKRWLSRVLLVLQGLIVALIFSEIGLRIIGFSNPIFYEYDEYLGWKASPNAEGWYQKEGKAYIKINSEGLRDREHAFSKPDSVIRVAVLGDSYAEAMVLPIEETFWSLAEQKLNSIKPFGNKSVEVINFGIGGYGTDQELVQLRRVVWNYSPDIVILAFFAGNDIRNNSHLLDASTGKPFFILKDGSLLLDTSFNNISPFKRFRQNILNSPKRIISHYSRIYQLYKSYKDYKHDREMREQMPADTIIGQEIGVGDAIYSAPKDLKWYNAWEITETLIVRMSREVKEKGADFFLLPVTASIQVHPDSSIRNHYIETMGMTDLGYPEERIKNLGMKNGFKVIPLIHRFQQHAEKNNKFLHGFKNLKMGFGHWNKDGHRLAADIIVDYLIEYYRTK
jgi:hypothetical protein